MEWTAQAIEDLLWWRAHTGSMQELADKLGVSKGVVCGKLFRLGPIRPETTTLPLAALG